MLQNPSASDYSSISCTKTATGVGNVGVIKFVAAHDATVSEYHIVHTTAPW